MDNSTGKKKIDEKIESCGSSGIPQELLDFKKICSSRCSICNSGILKQIHDWRKNGSDYNRIVERAKNEHSVEISNSGLSRHFKSYLAFKTEMSMQIIKNDTLEEVTAMSVHIKKTVELIDIAYEKIKIRIEANTLNLDVGDLEKLVKIRYQILNGEHTDDKDLMAIFQKASDDHGLNLQQGVLFK